jgi:hypothetical protein
MTLSFAWIFPMIPTNRTYTASWKAPPSYPGTMMLGDLFPVVTAQESHYDGGCDPFAAIIGVLLALFRV